MLLFLGGVYGAALAALYPLPAGKTPLPHALRVIALNSAVLGEFKANEECFEE